MPQNTPRGDAPRRRLEQQLQQRAVDDAARRRRTVIVAVAGAVVAVAVVIGVIVAVGGGSSAGSGAGNRGTTAGTVACRFAPDGTAARPVDKPAGRAVKAGSAVVDVATNRGPLTFTLDRAAAPCTVASFTSLVKQGFYDDTPCHRLTTAGIFVLQCGDPTGSGSGGPGYTVPDEFTGAEKYGTGVLAMANTGAPDSGGSQFFIVYADTLLPPKYTVFGTVTTGMDVVQAVAAKGAAGGTGDGTPNLPVQITSMKVVK